MSSQVIALAIDKDDVFSPGEIHLARNLHKLILTGWDRLERLPKPSECRWQDDGGQQSPQS